MKSRFAATIGVLGLAVALACASCASPVGPPASTDPAPGQVPTALPANPVPDRAVQQPTPGQAAALTKFGEQLFAQQSGGANPVVSPLSVFLALAMAYDGAGGTTAQAFQDVLGMTAQETRAVAAYLLTDLQSTTGGTTLAAANSAWLDTAVDTQQDWIDTLQAYYGADVYRTNLHAAGTVGDVNAWINQATHGQIPDMLDSIGADTVALLVNALYLQAAWAEEFPPSGTHQGTFTTADGRQVDAWYMTNPVATRKYIATSDAVGIQLPYRDGRLQFVAVMPASGDLTLDPATFSRWLAAATDRDHVTVTMPKFHTEFSVDLTDACKALGLGTAFDPATADFSGIGSADTGPLYLGQVIHKVAMDVGEHGTEAAAATVVGVGAGAPSDEIEIAFDRPYVYAIIDQVTGVPLFIGAMQDPSLAPPTVQ